ncbi:hypothetical protein [Halobacillus litoralis]|uniref:hypothetical protein n=1 Tax=Halobacillus litoralis TaxID=45668 RepID=UPI002493AFFD|nr:hypothetical protein [Halobacillus litoralis]
MNLYKISTSFFILTTIIFAYLWYDSEGPQPLNEFAVAAVTSSIKELPYTMEDVQLSFQNYHEEESTEKEQFYTRTLLARSLQNLNDNQRLISAAERSKVLEKGWFRDYSDALFTMRSILTTHSFENNNSKEVKRINQELETLQSSIEETVTDESFSTKNKKDLRSITDMIEKFNQIFS